MASSISKLDPPQPGNHGVAERVLRLTLLHFNDVYEVMPVGGGKLGGIARVTTLLKQLRKQNPNTFAFFGGDLYWPSAMGAVVVGGVPLDGRQNVAVMNTVGLDFMVLGDREFQVTSPEVFRNRLQETEFSILSANLRDASGSQFPNTADHAVFAVSDPAGGRLRIGVFGLTKDPVNGPVPVTYRNPLAVAAEQVQFLADRSDLLIALTHQPVRNDIALARQFPAIDLILGGDEHEQMAVEPGAGLAPIFKSDSNARSVYVLEVGYHLDSETLEVKARLQPITPDIAPDPETQRVVEHFKSLAFAALRATGLDPDEVLAAAPADLDGFASSVRSRPTELTKLFLRGMLKASPRAEVAFTLSSQVRLDDQIFADSPITRFDILRIFPFSATVVSAAMTGRAISEVLQRGEQSRGTGYYVLSANVTADSAGGWLINERPLALENSYTVVTTDDLLNEFLKGSADVKVLAAHGDIREVFVRELTTIAEPADKRGVA